MTPVEIRNASAVLLEKTCQRVHCGLVSILLSTSLNMETDSQQVCSQCQFRLHVCGTHLSLFSGFGLRTTAKTCRKMKPRMMLPMEPCAVSRDVALTPSWRQRMLPNAAPGNTARKARICNTHHARDRALQGSQKSSQLRLENVAYWRSTMAGNVLRSDIQEALLHKNFKHG